MDKKDKLLRNIFLTFAIIFEIGALEGIIMIVGDLLRYYNILITVLSLALFVLFFKLAIIKRDGYKLRYYFSNKKFKEQISNSLQKFKNADKEFVDKFVKSRKTSYRKTGNIFGDYGESDNFWMYKSEKNKKTLITLYKLLFESSKSGGFVEFLNQVDKLEMESWNIFSYFESDLVSNELRYLITEVWILTDLTLVDNGLSEKFTTHNENVKKELDERYSPILFGFEEELQTINKNLAKSVKKSGNASL